MKNELLERSLSQVKSKPVRWIWRGRIPRGKLAGLYGEGGCNKSTLLYHVAACISSGRPLPGEKTATTGKVLIISGEDDPDDTIKPRMAVMGANMENVFVLDIRSTDDEGAPARQEFTLEKLGLLDAAVREIGDVALVVIDPVSMYLADKRQNDSGQMAALLRHLNRFAGRHDIGLVVINGHFNKSRDAKDLRAKIAGAAAFTDNVRSSITVLKDRDVEDRRGLYVGKHNHTGKVPGLAFRIVQRPYRDDDGHEWPQEDWPIAVEWEDGEIDMDADQALAAMKGNLHNKTKQAKQLYLGGSKRKSAEQLLLELLDKGEMDEKEIWKRAQQAGISRGTLYRAKDILKIVSRRVGFGPGGKWIWRPSRTAIGEGTAPSTIGG